MYPSCADLSSLLLKFPTLSLGALSLYSEYNVLYLHAQNPTVEYMNSIYNPVPWEKDEYLKPVLEDDLLLQFGEMNLL